MSDFQVAGTYELLAFRIKNFSGNEANIEFQTSDKIKDKDIKFLIPEWSISESIYSNNTAGFAHIIDAVGIYHNFPLRGEEIIEIEYRDWFKQIKKETFFLFAVTDVEIVREADSSVLSYTIHFVSIGKFLSETVMLKKAYSMPISAMVTDVFANHFQKGPGGISGTKKKLFVEDTNGIQNLIVPFYSASEAMNFFSRHAASLQNTSSSFTFFETRDNYFFMTFEGLKKWFDENNERDMSDFTFGYNILPDDSPEAHVDVKMRALINYSLPKPFDTMNDLVNGTYFKKTIELDYHNRRAEETVYNYLEKINEIEDNLQPNHSKEFAERFLNDGKQFLVFKDYPGTTDQNRPGIKPKTYYSEFIAASWTTSSQHNRNRLSCQIYGRNHILPGSKMILELNKIMTNPSTEDLERSGEYIVESVHNQFFYDTYIQSLIISRGGLSK